MTAPLALDYNEIMINNLEVLGQFMYPADTLPRLLDLVRAGLLDLIAIQLRTFPFAELRAAMSAGKHAASRECIALTADTSDRARA